MTANIPPPPPVPAPSYQPAVAAPSGPSGFGGWLILVVLGQTIAPIRTLAETVVEYGRSQPVLAMQGGKIAVYGELAMNVALVIVQIWALVLMYGKRRFFPKAYVIECLAGVVVFFADVALVASALGLSVDQVVGQDNSLLRMIVQLLIQGLWAWYLFASVRARNTFVN